MAVQATSRVLRSSGRLPRNSSAGYELTLDIHRRTIDRCRAGVTAGEIYSFVVAEFDKKGIDYTASLVGHGMGPWFHQQEPVLRRGSDIVLEQGMIFAVEPQRLHWHLQDLILIEDGRAAPDLDQVSDRKAFCNRLLTRDGFCSRVFLRGPLTPRYLLALYSTCAGI